jgi:hypothetical protein
VKPILALALLAVAGLALVGCASTKKAASGSIRTVATTTGGELVAARNLTVLGLTATIANVRTGARVRCKGWLGPGVQVPPRGGEAGANVGAVRVTSTGKKTSLPSESLQLTHLRNGSIRVVCGTSR